jgi:hypothetical protein
MKPIIIFLFSFLCLEPDNLRVSRSEYICHTYTGSIYVVARNDLIVADQSSAQIFANIILPSRKKGRKTQLLSLRILINCMWLHIIYHTSNYENEGAKHSNLRVWKVHRTRTNMTSLGYSETRNILAQD